MLSPQDLFDLNAFTHKEIFDDCEFAWDALKKIGDYIKNQFAAGLEPQIEARVMEGAFIEGDVYIGQGTVVEPGAFIQGPTIIGENCEIRQGAYIRGNVLVGNSSVVGHTTELKNVILLEHVSAAHFAYVGDSILGNRVNIGAGTKLANLPVVSFKDPVTSKRPTIRIHANGREIDTGLAKLGAILGDEAQMGCNSVANPGCIVGPRTLVYPLVSLKKGYYPPDIIVKLRQQTQRMERR